MKAGRFPNGDFVAAGTHHLSGISMCSSTRKLLELQVFRVFIGVSIWQHD